MTHINIVENRDVEREALAPLDRVGQPVCYDHYWFILSSIIALVGKPVCTYEILVYPFYYHR